LGHLTPFSLQVCVFGDRIYKQDEEKWVGVPPFLYYVKLKLKGAVNGFFMLPFYSGLPRTRRGSG
jgi:hypothetical protein